MMETLTLLLRIAGGGLLLLAILHVPIGKQLKWREDAKRLTPVNASIFHVHTFFICVVLVMMGLPCLLEPAVFTEKSRAGAWLAWSISGFWALRLYFQWFVYQADLWRGKRMETAVHLWFTIVWAGLAALFAACGLWQAAGVMADQCLIPGSREKLAQHQINAINPRLSPTIPAAEINRSRASTLAALAGFHAAPAVAKPNIVIILADDMGYGDLGCYGGQQAPTPRLDRLASEGVRFTQFYSASPVCSPSRAGWLTGMFPARWRITNYLQTREGNRASEQADFLDPKAPSIARQLKAAGYATGHFGKWHLGGGRDVVAAPQISAYGFDESASTWESPETQPEIDGGKIKRWERTAFVVDKSLDFLKRHPQQPCFVQLWPDDVHTPWVTAGQAARGDTPANFRPVLEEADRQVGRLLDGLRDLGLEQNTLVIFASDNGPMPTFGGTRAGGLRGAKWSLYEAGIRLPLIVRWPGQVPAGKVDESTVLAAVDLLPSLCAIAGGALPEGAVLDGENLSAAWFGRPVVRTHSLFWEYGRNATFKYPIGRDRSPNLAVREGEWKLLLNADGSGIELYDVITDRAEEHDLATVKPELAKRLAEAALRWRRELPTAN